jgi:hypothetical protein
MPYNSTYVQTGVTTPNTIIRITGASGVDFTWPFQYDIYFNGQKMTTGVDYTLTQVSTTGTRITSSTSSSWNYSFFDFNITNYLELKFVPFKSGVIKTVYAVTGNTSLVTGVSGYGEQVWVNGLRQGKGTDYLASQPCRFCTGNFAAPNYGFKLYNTVSDNTVDFVEPYMPITPTIGGGYYVWDFTTPGYADIFVTVQFNEPFATGIIQTYVSPDSVNYYLLDSRNATSIYDLQYAEATTSEADFYFKSRFIGANGTGAFSSPYPISVSV